ncbi:MAG: ubiquinone/menaquinone biosynthesis methyltransferase [Gemmatimonadaceae bacterium]|nr:ubiquinone/menaquinone biosynthesis methyltransferase [Gemmatimonadaceae bacterium]
MTGTETERSAAREAAAGGSAKRAYVQRMFSDIAPSYDMLNRVLSMGVDRSWRREAVRALNWARRRDGLYLDLCAGTLDVSALLASRRGFGGRVLAADFAEPMLRSGRGKGPAGRIFPVVADALTLPVADGSCDGALVAFGIRNVTDLGAALREVLRALSPGSRFVILEFSTPSSSPMRALYHFYFHHVLPMIGRTVSGHPTAYQYLPESVAHFPEGAVLADRMRSAGYVNVSWRPLTMGIAALHVGERA